MNGGYRLKDARPVGTGPRQRFAEAAFEALLADGYARTSIGAISEAADVPVVEALRLCRSMPEVFVLVCAHRADEVVRGVRADGTSDPLDVVLLRALRPWLDDLRERATSLRPALADVLSDPTARALLVRGFFSCQQDLAVELRRRFGR